MKVSVEEVVVATPCALGVTTKRAESALLVNTPEARPPKFPSESTENVRVPLSRPIIVYVEV